MSSSTSAMRTRDVALDLTTGVTVDCIYICRGKHCFHSPRPVTLPVTVGRSSPIMLYRGEIVKPARVHAIHTSTTMAHMGTNALHGLTSGATIDSLEEKITPLLPCTPPVHVGLPTVSPVRELPANTTKGMGVDVASNV